MLVHFLMEVTEMIDRIRELLAETKLAGIFQDVQFPITKAELMEIAEEHNAPDKAIELLDRLPEQTFDSIAAVFEHLRGAKEGD